MEMEKAIVTEGTVNRRKRQKGVTTLEYAIMLIMVALVVLAFSGSIKSSVSKTFSQIASGIQ